MPHEENDNALEIARVSGEVAALTGIVTTHGVEIAALRLARHEQTNALNAANLGFEAVKHHLEAQDKYLQRNDQALFGDGNGNKGLIRRFDGIESEVKTVREDVQGVRQGMRERAKGWTKTFWIVFGAAAGAVSTVVASHFLK